MRTIRSTLPYHDGGHMRVPQEKASIRPMTRYLSLGGITAAMLLLGAGTAAAQAAGGALQDLDCLIEPRMVVKVGSPVDGIVGAVTVDRGDVVASGQVVARLESRVEEATLALAEARAGNTVRVQSTSERAAYEQRRLARARQLSAKNVLAQSALDEADTEAKLAELVVSQAAFEQEIDKLELARAREVVALRSIRSPVDGVVVDRQLSPGEYAHEQAHIVTIAQMHPLNVEVFVPIGMFGRIHPGMPAEVRPQEPVGGVHAAAVDVVDTVFDAASGTFGVRLRLDNPDHRLPAGLRCTVRFAAGQG